MRLVAFFRERVPGFAHARIAATATQIGVRESRRIVGEYTLTRDDILERRTFDDAQTHFNREKAPHSLLELVADNLIGADANT